MDWKKLIIILVLVVLFLAIGFWAGRFFSGGPGEERVVELEKPAAVIVQQSQDKPIMGSNADTHFGEIRIKGRF